MMGTDASSDPNELQGQYYALHSLLIAAWERITFLERTLEYEAWCDNQQFAAEARPTRHLRAA